MSCIRLLAPTIFGLSLAMPAQHPDAPPSAPLASVSPAAQLIATDRAIWQAISGSRPNIEEVGRALAPDYIDMEAGVIHSRADVLKDLADVRDFSFHYDHPRAVVLSPTTGYVVAELTYRTVVKDVPATGRVLTTSVFTRVGGRWISHLHTEMDMKP